jgi:hypothetical protein
MISNGPLGWLVAFDNSVVGRQLRGMVFENPQAWGKAFKGSHRALMSEGKAQLLMDGIMADKDFGFANKMGVELTSMDAAASLASAEEASMFLRTAGKIHPIAQKILRPFDRAFTVGANVARHEAFYAMRRAMGDSWTEAEYKAYANFLNAMTGRGNLGRLGQFQPELNAVFISARQFVGDIQTFAAPLHGPRSVR